MKSKRPTLADVAERAGVSTATVARVLHQRGYVAEGRRRAVERAVAETGYSLNLLAQSLRRQRTGIIGHVLHAIHPNPFYAQVALGVEQEAMARGYGVLAYNVQTDRQREQAGVRTLIQRRVDAIVFTTPLAADNVRLAADSGMPVVQVERPTDVETATVRVDNYGGTTAAMEHLLALGHERVAYIGARFTTGSWSIEEQRFRGYRDSLERWHLAYDERLVGLGDSYSLEDTEFSANDGYRFACRLLDSAPRPTAIVAACDLLAAGVLQALYERMLRVPADVSVIGFDNTLAPYLTPPLTTVAQPMLEIGRAAARLAIEQVEEGQVRATATEHLALHLLVRQSTGVPAQGWRRQ